MFNAFFQIDDLRRFCAIRRFSSSSSSLDGLNASCASSMVGDAERGDGSPLPSSGDGDGGIINGIDCVTNTAFERLCEKSGEFYTAIIQIVVEVFVNR